MLDSFESQKEISESPLKPKSFIQQGFGLQKIGGTLPQHVLSVIRANGLDARIQVKSMPNNLGLVSHPNNVNEFYFAVNGFKLCDFQVKAHQVKNYDPYIVGQIPQLKDVADLQATDWPAIEDAQAMIQNRAYQEGIASELTLESKEACIKVVNQEMRPVWKTSQRSGTLLYQAIADGDQVYNFQPQFFDIDGKASIYSNNSTDGKVKEFTLRDLDGTGKLSSKYFYTVMDGHSQEALASAADNNFTFTPGTSAFDETSVFTNVSRHLEWLQTLGYNSFGTRKLALVIHAVVQGDINNALYQPTSNGPVIFVGDGDGQILQNLATDSEVVSHELGHHVIYKTITSIEGDSLVLHEGLADYFTFARTGNTCLGESICPKGSRVCAIQDQCLRTADNDYRWGDANLPEEAHLRSQLISGFLWDLKSKDNIASSDVDQLVLKSIDFYTAKTSYATFFLALLHSDLETFNGKYCSTIFDRAKTRGFSTFLKGVSCDAPLPAIDSTNSDAGTTIANTPSTKTKSSKGGNVFCGAISGDRHGSQVFLILLLAFPLALVGILRRIIVS